ncbi:hypothetical protein HPB50_008270 [Hyalomma asiaticum]|uniref:Uncharacterized protein n=1 Tax=Hyalomma asiaticum TaxID=266040 RepID=A0ACB7RMK1_HYAAI|nr:hypothetical protein HPB50_008270 [Hyalomma asiaticum]
MASEDIDKLCHIFHTVPIETLESVDDQNLSWLLPIRGLNLLKAVQDERERLHRVATLYAWLVPRGAYKSWALYHLDEFLATLDASEVAGMTTLQARNWPALAFVLGNLEQCSPSMYDDLKRAHSVAEIWKLNLSDCFT